MNPDNTLSPTITVIICTLNEAENLPYVLPEIPSIVSEVILVDGHSSDGTIEIAKKIRPDIKVVTQRGKGKGDALRCGISYATGDIIVTIDADGATDPAYIPRFITPLLHGYDFVKGSRFIKGSIEEKPLHRIIGNCIITMTFDLLFFKTYTDICSGYNAFWKKTVDKVNLNSKDGYENEPLVHARMAKAGIKVAEIGYREKNRIKGEVKEKSWRQGSKAIKTILRERF